MHSGATIQFVALELSNRGAPTHVITVEFQSGQARAEVRAEYQAGPLANLAVKAIAEWSATYEPPNKYDPGSIHFGDGRIDILIPELRGIGLGSLLMRPLIKWAQAQPTVPVARIFLSGEDAGTPEAMRTRNRFYKKLGFQFNYEEGGIWGRSRDMDNTQLIVPAFCLSNGWTVISLGDYGASPSIGEQL